jgi:DNA (cytosine-5)-methyltransferase 1
MGVTAVSLFSGCGGFDLGASEAGVEILWANDINRHAAATYQKYLPNVEFHLGDIRKIEKKCLPQADLLIGCYPCQGFSSGAWRRWKTLEERDLFANVDNYLYQEFIKAIPYVDPKFIFIENVGGLKSSAGGWFFQAQRKALEKAGFRVFDARLNVKDFGVAQSRERVFIVGVRRRLRHRYLFPEPKYGPGRAHGYVTQQDMIAGMPEWPEGEYETGAFHGHYLTRNRKMPWSECSYTIVAHSHHVPLHPMGEPMKKVGKDLWELQGKHNRRLSWRECALLQSFGDDFEPEGHLDAKYAQIGNSVPPLMAKLLVAPAVQLLESRRASEQLAPDMPTRLAAEAG